MFKKYVGLRVCLIVGLLSSSIAYNPNLVFGRVNERAITFSGTGHGHTGGSDGKTVTVTASDVTNIPAGDIVATDVQSAVNELDTSKIPLTQKGAASGVATLDGTSKIPTAQIPAIAITDVYSPADEAAQLALGALQGDVAVRADTNISWIHNGGTAGTMADWTELETVGYVQSVNGDTGVVTGMEETVNRQTIITDDDTRYPTSGAVVDKVDITHAGNADAHQAKSHLHDGLDGSGVVDAEDVTFTSLTGLASTEVEAALDELNSGATVAHDSAKIGDVSNRYTYVGSITNGTGTYISFNCDESSGTWTADDTTKQASAITFTDDGIVTVWVKNSTASPWLHSAWDQSNVVNNVNGQIEADGIILANSSVRVTRSSAGLDAFQAMVTGDSNFRFLVDVEGKTTIGTGATAGDTNLYRDAANSLITDDEFTAGRDVNAGSVNGMEMTVGGDTETAGADQVGYVGFNCYRRTSTDDWEAHDNASPASVLKYDEKNSRFYLYYKTTTTTAWSSWDYGNILMDFGEAGASRPIQTYYTGTAGNAEIRLRQGGDTSDRFELQGDGSLDWGAGTGAATDTNLYRSASNVLKTDDTFQAVQAIGLDMGDAGYNLTFGSAGDTNLYRSAPNTLKTDDNLIVGGGRIDVFTDVFLQRNGTNQIGLGAGDAWSVDTAANYKHGTTTKVVPIHASSFEPTNTGVLSAEQWGTPARVRPSATGNNCYAQSGIPLPNGATITRLDGYGSTNSGVTNRVDITLNRITLTSNAATIMGTCFYSDGGVTCNDVTISSAVVDNTIYSYSIEVKVYGASALGDASFYNSKITYTTTDMSMTQ